MDALMVAVFYGVAAVVVGSLFALTQVEAKSVKMLYAAAILICFYFVSVVALHHRKPATAVVPASADPDLMLAVESKAIGDELGKRYLEIRKARNERERNIDK